MKTIYIILVVVLLSGLGVGVAFWVTKKKKNEKKEATETKKTTLEQREKAVDSDDSVTKPKKNANQVQVKESLKFDIQVSNMDTRNRSFDYYMHFGGIPLRGKFKDELTGNIEIKKSFGGFRVFQLKKADSVSSKIGATRIGGKGAAAKGKTDHINIGSATPLADRGDNVELSIVDNNNKILKLVSVNLTTGATKTANLNPQPKKL